MWITWAKQSGQDNLCLSLATPSDPFRTCLIGKQECAGEAWKNYTSNWQNETVAIEKYCEWFQQTDLFCQHSGVNKTCGMHDRLMIRYANQSLTEVQELRLLGSAPGQWCVDFSDSGMKFAFGMIPEQGYNVTPNSDRYVVNRTEYCTNSLKILRSSKKAQRLPQGYFLICGDRAWTGIPANAFGGPCYLGKLTMFSPNIAQLLAARHTTVTRRHKRATTQLGPDCKDKLNLWDPPEVIFASILAPGVAGAQVLTQLWRLACWTGKQLNITSNIISNLVTDLGSVRHAVLQNRAAIDFFIASSRTWM